MLDHLGDEAAAAELEAAVESVLVNPEARTRVLGGTADTRGCGEAIL
jgi:tartrate dehydrogenase/decarboxylase/D-malate dehydrogenase